MFYNRSNIIFKTAGVLLDEMLDKGIAALKYKVIILDEVHERSVESDLVLACLKQFMLKNNNLRLGYRLMSSSFVLCFYSIRSLTDYITKLLTSLGVHQSLKFRFWPQSLGPESDTFYLHLGW